MLMTVRVLSQDKIIINNLTTAIVYKTNKKIIIFCATTYYIYSRVILHTYYISWEASHVFYELWITEYELHSCVPVPWTWMNECTCTKVHTRYNSTKYQCLIISTVPSTTSRTLPRVAHVRGCRTVHRRGADGHSCEVQGTTRTSSRVWTAVWYLRCIHSS